MLDIGRIYKVTNYLTGVMNVRSDDGEYFDFKKPKKGAGYLDGFGSHWSDVMGSLPNALGTHFEVLAIKKHPSRPRQQFKAACNPQEVMLKSVDGDPGRVFWVGYPGFALTFAK